MSRKGGAVAYSQAQLVGKACEGVLLKQRADKLMDKAELLTGAEVEQVGEDARPLRPGAVLEVLADLGKEEVLVVCCVAPVGLVVRRARRCGRGRRRRRRAGELLKVGRGRRAGGRGVSEAWLLHRRDAVVERWVLPSRGRLVEEGWVGSWRLEGRFGCMQSLVGKSTGRPRQAQQRQAGRLCDTKQGESQGGDRRGRCSFLESKIREKIDADVSIGDSNSRIFVIFVIFVIFLYSAIFYPADLLPVQGLKGAAQIGRESRDRLSLVSAVDPLIVVLSHVSRLWGRWNRLWQQRRASLLTQMNKNNKTCRCTTCKSCGMNEIMIWFIILCVLGMTRTTSATTQPIHKPRPTLEKGITGSWVRSK